MTKTTHSVLVIDDNDINRKYLNTLLSNNGFLPLLAEGGHQALDILDNNKVDLILVDIQMPVMDGFECFKAIRSKHGMFCPILAITAFSDLSDKKAILEFGFNDYLLKPAKPDALIQTLNHWIGNFSFKVDRKQNAAVDHIDEAVLNELLRFTDETSLLQLIDEFIDEVRTNIESISFLMRANRHAEILSILHTIKGNSGSFGFVLLAEKAAEIEILIKNDKLTQADSDLKIFIEYSEFLLRDYQRLLKIN